MSITYQDAIKSTLYDYLQMAERGRLSINGVPLTEAQAVEVVKWIQVFVTDIEFKVLSHE